MTSVNCRKFWKIFMMYRMHILSWLSIQIFWKLIYYIYWQVKEDFMTRIRRRELEQKGNQWHDFTFADKIMKIFGHVGEMYIKIHKYRVLHNVAFFAWTRLTTIHLQNIQEYSGIFVNPVQPKKGNIVQNMVFVHLNIHLTYTPKYLHNFTCKNEVMSSISFLL